MRLQLQWGRYCAAGATLLALMGSVPAAQATPALVGAALRANPASGQPVGTTVTWSATSTGLKSPVYRFSVGTSGGPSHVVRDFSRSPSITWTPMHEGNYTVQVLVKDGFAASSTMRAAAGFTIRSRVTGGKAVVSPSSNPLVALYSAPACSSGTLVVQFRPSAGSSAWQSTAAQRCSRGQSVNVLVAGMRPSTRYLLRHVWSGGARSAASTPLSFTTGKPAGSLKITPFTVKQASSAQADRAAGTVFHALVPVASPALANPIATDLGGNLVWYYDTLRSGLTEVWPVHAVPGGTVLLLGLDRYHSRGDDVLREVDLAGDPVRETNIDFVNAQLALRRQDPIYMFHHDALRLPNGDTAVLGATQRRIGGHNVMGDTMVVLDPDFQVVWVWNLFDHFTPSTTWPAGTATCITTGALCALPDVKAIDWTHANGIGWSPEDGDLTLSFRDINTVSKIAYQNGHGNGKVLWQLGTGGNLSFLDHGGSFTVRSSAPIPWFSGQHNATYVNATDMVIFDDGNARCGQSKVKGCQSRGQEWRLDEQHHVATLLVNVNLGSYWQALGSAQGLPGGNLTFAGGFAPPSREVEVSPEGTKVYELDTGAAAVYRAYWLTGLSF